MTSKLHIRLLGDFQLRYEGAVRAPGALWARRGADSPRLQALLAYLLLHRDASRSRQQLAYLLWPDSSDSGARVNLRSLLLRLKRVLPQTHTFIHTDAGQIRWLPDAPYTLDVADFEKHVAAAQTAKQADDSEGFETAARQAVATYTGDLLPDCYDDWIIPFREQLHEAFIACLLHLAAAALRTHQFEAAAEHYRTLTRLNPLWEEATRGLMRALVGLQRFGEAIAAYNQLEQVLAEELGIAPAPQTQDMAAALKEEASFKTAMQRQQRVKRLPFVGRAAERGRLLQHLDQLAEGKGGLVVLLGEAGMGKTRLLEEVAQAADWRSWQVAWGRGQEFTLPSAYAPLSEALDQALPPPRIQQLVHLMPSVWLATIARLVPAVQEILATELPALSMELPHGLVNKDEPPRLASAIGALAKRLQTIAPQVFVLDDVQWSDSALWPLLDELREHLAQAAVLLVLSGRSEELKSQSTAWSLLRHWDQAGVPIISLAGMEADELEALVEANGLETLEPAERQQLQITSGGNPLFALSLLESGDLSTTAEDPTLAGQMLRRIATVSQPAQDALQGAAVIGYRFDYRVWEAVVAVSEPALLPSLAGELEGAGLIRLDAGSYCFDHDTLRACVYTHIPAPRRRRLHQKTLAALVTGSPRPVGGDFVGAPEVAGDVFALLHHAEQAGDRPAVSRYALSAGQQALSAFTYQTAVAHFSRALATLARDDWPARYAAVLGRVRALNILAQREAQRADLEQLQALAAHLDDDHQVDAAIQWAGFYWVTGDYPAARQAAESGLARAQRAATSPSNHARQATLLHMLAQVARNYGQYAPAQEQTRVACELYRLAGSRHGEASMTDFLGGLAWEVNQYHDAAVHHAAAAEIFREIGDLMREAMALNNLGAAYWGLGNYSHARTTHERALAASQALGHRRSEADNLDNLGGVSWVLGDYPAAIALYNQALAIRRQIGDNWGVSISLGNLGSAYRLQGDIQSALAFYGEALPLTRRIGRRLGQAYNLYGRGLALLEARPKGTRLDEAGEALLEALTLRTELGQQTDRLETLGALALLALARADLYLAQRYLTEMLALLTALGQVRPDLRQWSHYVAYRVHHALGDPAAAVRHLVEAQTAMMEVAAPLALEDRRRFLTQVPLNRQVEAAVAEKRRHIRVRLVRADAPRGRSLTAADTIAVTWTTYSPEDNLHQGTVARRRHVIKRLLAEAESQDAAATGDELAAALAVSRRTILRDMQALAAAGVMLPGRQKATPTKKH